MTDSQLVRERPRTAISPDLLDLRERLLDAGMVVVEEPDHLAVRLPCFCSVRVFSDLGRLRLEPHFGALSRGRATILKFGAMTALAVASLRFGYVYPVGMSMVVVLLSAYEIIRWIISEQAITRVQLLSAVSDRMR